MPTYEYACAKCGHTFEVVQRISAGALTVCPETLCTQKKWGRGRVKRAIGAGAGLIFKGSGFYTTDYRSDGYKAAAKKESEAKTPPATGSTTGPAKPEAKPASKPATAPASTP